MKNLLTLFLLLVLTTACNKAKHTILNGQVRTYGTQEAIRHPPVKVQILHQEFASAGLGGSNTHTPIAETWSDQDGYFTIDANLRKNDSYFLGVDPETVKESYHYASPSYGMIDHPDHLITDRGGTFTMNHDLVAYGWVNFHFFSTNPEPGDEYWYNLGGGATEVFFNSVDVYRVWDFGGNAEHKISLIKVDSDGQRTPWQEYFFVPALDTIDYEVKFP